MPLACPRAPDLGALASRTLSADELARAVESCQWIVDDYKARGWDVQFTVQTPLGDIYDLFDPAIMPGSHDQPPPAPPLGGLQLPAGVMPAKLELSGYPELAWPSWMMPKVRPNFSLYISGLSGATSADDFARNHPMPVGSPSGGQRLYAGISSTNDPVKKSTPTVEASTSVMAYAGPIQAGTLSVLEMVVGCRNLAEPGMPMWQQVGIAASRDNTDKNFPQNNKDSVLRLQVEFLTHGPNDVGETRGGWAGSPITHDFHQYHDQDNSLAPGMAMFPSQPGGLQYESYFWIKLWNGNWWVGWNGLWLGYFPGALFDGGFDANACEVTWYAEVFDPEWGTPDHRWTTTDISGGHYAEEGWGWASYFRNPSYVDASEMPQSHWADQGGRMLPYNAKCYSQSNLTAGPSPFDWMLFAGGAGGGNKDCDGILP